MIKKIEFDKNNNYHINNDIINKINSLILDNNLFFNDFDYLNIFLNICKIKIIGLDSFDKIFECKNTIENSPNFNSFIKKDNKNKN